MHTDREETRIVRSWLEEGVTALPDRVLDAVLDQIPMTPQRRSWWPSWRFSDMNKTLKVAAGAAAVLAVALVGYNVLPPSAGTGGPAQTPVATLAPTPSPTMVPEVVVGSLEAGTYLMDDPRLTAVPFTFTVPEGWSARADGVIYTNDGSSSELNFYPFVVTHVYTDACQSEGALDEIGPAVDDLVEALADQLGSDASSPVDVTFGGYTAKRIDMSIPADQDTSTCRYPGVGFQIWADPLETNFFAIPADQVGAAFPVYIADVDGDRAVILPSRGPDASASDIAELDAVLASIRFVP